MYVWERESEGVERNNGGLLTWSYRLQKVCHLIHISSLLVHPVKWIIFPKKSLLQMTWWMFLWRWYCSNIQTDHGRKTSIIAAESCHLILGWKPPIMKSKGTKWSSRNVETYWCLFDGPLWLLLIHLQHMPTISKFFASHHQTASRCIYFISIAHRVLYPHQTTTKPHWVPSNCLTWSLLLFLQSSSCKSN